MCQMFSGLKVHVVMLLCTCLYHLWEPFSVLDFIASEFCFIWLCNEVFVKWSVLWSRVLLQFCVSDHGLVTVAWDSSKICVFCTIGFEADLYDWYVSACVMSLWCWLKNIWCCVLYDPSAISTACIDSVIQSVAWYDFFLFIYNQWCVGTMELLKVCVVLLLFSSALICIIFKGHCCCYCWNSLLQKFSLEIRVLWLLNMRSFLNVLLCVNMNKGAYILHQ